MTFAASLCCVILPLLQQPQDKPRVPNLQIKLPPAERAEPQGRGAAPAQRSQSESERFRRDLAELTGNFTKVEQKLLDIGQRYPDLESLTIEVLRLARAQELAQVAQVAQRYGTTKVGDELKFQLLTRPLGDATKAAVDAMVGIYARDPQQNPNAALGELVQSRITGVRRFAIEALAARATAAELPFALELTSDRSLDLQLRGVDLLRAIHDQGALDRMVELLSRDPVLAGHTCAALIGLRGVAVPSLLRLLREPAIDRGFCYAAFALAEIGVRQGQCLLEPVMAPGLVAKLGDRDPLARTLAAVALADFAHYQPGGGGPGCPDAAILDVLVEIADGSAMVANLDLLRQPIELRLQQFAGRIGGEALGWKAWWQQQRADFVGIRARVGIDSGNAAHCLVALRQERGQVRLLAEGLADQPAVPGVQDVLLSAERMRELVEALLTAGFGSPEATVRNPAGLPLVRALQIRLPAARMQMVATIGEQPAFDALAAVVQRFFDEELWQLYRHPVDEPDRAAFWRAECRWRAANPDPVARGRRLVGRVVANWSVLTTSLRARAVEYLFAAPNRRELLDEETGAKLLAIVAAAGGFGEMERHLLELAAIAPGDRVWRDAIELATKLASQPAEGASAGGTAGPVAAAPRDAGKPNPVRIVFGVLGADAILLALADARPAVRRVAVEEVVRTRDLRAAARLVELLGDADPAVQVAAANGCGQLPVPESSRRLIELIATETTPAPVRREALRSLGRVGGPQAFAVLDRAVLAPSAEDKEAALRGLGELRDARSATLLAELAVSGHGKDLGSLARFYLQRMGGTLAVPALRHQLRAVADPAIRTHLVLLLGGYQDPEVAPQLMDLLSAPQYQTEAAVALSCTTGVDLLNQSDRVGAFAAFWRRQRTEPQWQWLLDGLRVAEVPTVLRPELFAPGMGLAPVPELARLLVECKQAHLRVLASAVLREVAKVDYGVISMQSTAEVCESIASRYRILVETEKAALGK
ncbi:MAG: HEAT repeat domain-containing protein [Planctomycetes bacterium]|nr:HEAT repeat domain-containing protein [Planctomycetota bacterium]